MNISHTNLPKKKLPLTMIILALIFIAPFIFAWYFYITQESREFKLMHHGQLVKPAKDLRFIEFTDPETNQAFTAKDLAGKWWVIYVSPDKCLETCHENLYNIKQMLTALGKEGRRVSSL